MGNIGAACILFLLIFPLHDFFLGRCRNLFQVYLACMIFFHKIFSGTNTFFVLHPSPPQPPPNPLMVSNGPLPLYREQGKGIPLQYYRSRVLNDPCNWDVFGVRGSGLGIMKTQGRIVLGLLLQEPFVKRFVYQPNKRIYECFCFCCFFFLRR